MPGRFCRLLGSEAPLPELLELSELLELDWELEAVEAPVTEVFAICVFRPASWIACTVETSTKTTSNAVNNVSFFILSLHLY